MRTIPASRNRKRCLGPVFPTIYDFGSIQFVRWIFPHFLDRLKTRMCPKYVLILHQNLLSQYTIQINILRKTIEGYQNYFVCITFGNIIFKQSNFVSDRTITMQFTKMQNEIYGPLVTIPYHAKCTNPLYPNFTSNKFSA